jgi:hypothetical protein
VTLADVDMDGNPDLVVAEPSGVAILLGKADGTFKTAPAYPRPTVSPWCASGITDKSRRSSTEVLKINKGTQASFLS